MIDDGKLKDNNIQSKPKKKVSFVLPFIVAAVIFVVMIVAIVGSISIGSIITDDDLENVCYQIDCVTVDDEEVTVNGWAFRLGIDTTESNDESDIKVVLENIEDKSRIILETESGIKRQDVNDYFYCEYDYTNCGFVAKGTDCAKAAESGFEILLQFGNDKNAVINTGTYFSEGQLLFANPNEYKKLDTDNTDLAEIVNEGYLKVYNPEVGIYVYQHDNKLYWIADEYYEFDVNDLTYIQYQLYTTQREKLPENRIANGWYWDNISDNFESYEITNVINCGKYRVSVRDIPTTYSVTSILTGYAKDGNWIWSNKFIPRYEFDVSSNRN